MKRLLNRFPILSSYIFGFLLFGGALIGSGILNRGVVKEYFPYFPVVLLLFATWFLLRRENKSLRTIGLNLSIRNLSFFPLGVLIGAFAFLGSKYARAWYLGETIEIGHSFDYEAILLAFYFILPQVATEELLFRGYMFQRTISLTNVVIANIIFAILFMLIHVLDENILQNIGMIIFMALSIPVGHLWFATGLVKSRTLFFPIGLHLGNNWATRHLISENSSGESFLVISNQSNLETWTEFFMMLLLTNGVFLLVTFFIWKWDRIVSIFIRRQNYE